MNLKPFLFLFLLACLIAPAAAAGGSGTAASPYIIETAAELQSIHNNLGAYYRLANDIDLSSVTWTPIGTDSAGFYGELDGNGKTIKNLELSATTQSAGLFYRLTSGATIKDLTLEDCHVESTSTWCGVVIGSIIMSSSAHETAVISNVDLVRCSVSTSSDYVGCLVGLIFTSAEVEITDCDVSYSKAENTYATGCLVGACYSMSSTEITRCNVLYSHARARGGFISCFVGQCYSSSLVIDSSSAQNSIAETLTQSSVGCFVGNCGSTASVNVLNSEAVNCLAKGTDDVGGIFGVSSPNSVITAQMCEVTDCTIVATNNYAGGIMGRVGSDNAGTFTDCTVTDSTIIASGYAAGVCPAYS